VKVAPSEGTTQEPVTRSRLQWARRNDCCFAQDRSKVIRCAPYTAAKWLIVCIFSLVLFWLHFGFWLARFFAGGAFHKALKKCCPDGNCAFYMVAGIPLLIDYLIAFAEMVTLGGMLMGAFFATFGVSILNPYCAYEACVELMAVSEGIYKNVLSQMPPGLDHPCKMFGGCGCVD